MIDLQGVSTVRKQLQGKDENVYLLAMTVWRAGLAFERSFFGARIFSSLVGFVEVPGEVSVMLEKK
jgi:hypothetical protein